MGINTVSKPLRNNLFLTLVHWASRMLCQVVIHHICERVKVAEEDGAPLGWLDVNVGILKVGKSTLVRNGAGK